MYPGQKFYKVVSHRKYWGCEKDYTKLYSSYIHSRELSDFITEYRVGEWTSPAKEGTPGIFTFGNLSAAEVHMSCAGADKIYLCEVREPKEFFRILAPDNYFGDCYFKLRMAEAGSKLDIAQKRWPSLKTPGLEYWMKAVEGTFGCSAVKLTDLIKENHIR
jgi:hypothetical protein